MNNVMRYLLPMLLMLVCFAAVGCEQALFPDKYQRTPYERYDRFHGRYAPRQQLDPYGEERPALRERLSPYIY